jgi:hypothetical protein
MNITFKIWAFTKYWTTIIIGAFLLVIVSYVLMLIIPLALMFVGQSMGYPQHTNLLGNIGFVIDVVILCILNWKSV